VDFFTPVVDDPYDYGQIAAANALSDIYAMGGVPKTAMNLVAFPVKKMDMEILRRIIQGGLDKMTEAGVVLIGGHSVEDRELKYGLSVTGLIHPARILPKKALQVGDGLILTKPLGTGIVNTAIKGGLAPEKLIDRVTRLMATLNRKAAEIMADFLVHACTDITGFGLLGHLAEMVEGTDTAVVLHLDKIPIIPEAKEFAAMGFVPGGAKKNRAFRKSMVAFDAAVDKVMEDVLFDPQTSGGLLISAAESSVHGLLEALNGAGIEDVAVIGEVVSEAEEKIMVR
jgi:selenide,water dikinase